MLERKFRDAYQIVFINPILKLCSDKITPNKVTILSGIAGVLVIPGLVTGHIWLGVFFLLLSGYFDTLDGSLARLQNKATQIGSALDIVMDRFVEWAVVFAFYLVDSNRAILCFFMLAANMICVTSFLVVGIFVEQNSNKSFFYHEGLMERAEAFIFFVLMMIFPDYFIPLAVIYIFLVFLTAFLHLQFFNNWQQEHPK